MMLASLGTYFRCQFSSGCFLREVQVVNEDEDKIIMVFNDVQCSMVAEVVVLH